MLHASGLNRQNKTKGNVSLFRYWPQKIPPLLNIYSINAACHTLAPYYPSVGRDGHCPSLTGSHLSFLSREATSISTLGIACHAFISILIQQMAPLP